jgi:hypothetical protein
MPVLSDNQSRQAEITLIRVFLSGVKITISGFVEK